VNAVKRAPGVRKGRSGRRAPKVKRRAGTSRSWRPTRRVDVLGLEDIVSKRRGSYTSGRSREWLVQDSNAPAVKRDAEGESGTLFDFPKSTNTTITLTIPGDEARWRTWVGSGEGEGLWLDLQSMGSRGRREPGTSRHCAAERRIRQIVALVGAPI
jgi:hypothetical protein